MNSCAFFFIFLIRLRKRLSQKYVDLSQLALVAKIKFSFIAFLIIFEVNTNSLKIK